MILRWLLLFAVAFSPRASSAAMTVAWRVPFDWIAPRHETHPGVHRLDKAPAESAYFQPGDELWDVSGVLHWNVPVRKNDGELSTKSVEGPWPGQWLVWNARSGLVIGRGEPNEILSAEIGMQVSDLPMSIRTTFELKSQRSPTRTVTLLSRDQTEAEIHTGGWDLRFTPGHIASYCSLKLLAGWPVENSPARWEVATTVSSAGSGEKKLLARQGDWELSATMKLELADGTPLEQARSREIDGKIVNWTPKADELETLTHALDDGRWIAYGRWHDVIASESDLTWASKLGFEAPGKFQPGVHGRFLDAAPYLKDHIGADLNTPDYFAGYDPLADCFVVISDPAIADQVSNSGTQCLPFGSYWIESSPASGGWGLSCNDEEVSSIVRKEDGQEELRYELRPSYAESPPLLETPQGSVFKLHVHFTMDVVAGGGPARRISSQLDLPYDQPVPIAPEKAAEDFSKDAVYLKLNTNP